jgi:hypothetical protein
MGQPCEFQVGPLQSPILAGVAGVALAAAVTGVAEADGELGQRARPATGRRVILPSCHRLPLAVIP